MATFDDMTMDEIIDRKVAMKAQIVEIQEEMRVAEAAHSRKHMVALAEQALRNAGVTGVTIMPESAIVSASGADTGVEA